VCDLVRRNLGPLLHHFRDIACFSAHDPTLFHPNFWVFPLDQIAYVAVSPSRNLKLISREIIYNLYETESLKDIPERHRQIDRRTT